MNIDLLRENYGASSANDKNYKNLWIEGAVAFPLQLQEILKFIPLENITIKNIKDLGASFSSEELKKTFIKHGTDKATVHDYHLIYDYIFQKLGVNSKLRILEIGIGTNNPDLISTMGSGGSPGASLRSLKEYLPNSEIYGADIDRDILFSEEGISTAFLDQLSIHKYEEMHQAFGVKPYDLIIDDGLHSIHANLNTIIFSLNKIRLGGWIVIEDIDRYKIGTWNVIDTLLKTNKNFKTFMIDTNMRSWVYVINKVKQDEE